MEKASKRPSRYHDPFSKVPVSYFFDKLIDIYLNI